MQRHYGVRTMKNCLWIFIVALAGTGVATVVTGASVMSHTKGFIHFLDPIIHSFCTAMMTVGSIAFVLAIMGCYAGINDSFILLIIFAVFMIAISVVEVTVGTLSLIKRTDIVQDLDPTTATYRTVREHKQSWDYVHQEFKCCGVYGKESWIKQVVPLSCCHSYEMGHDPSGYCDYQGKGKYLFVEGCEEKIIDQLSIYSILLMGICAGSALVKMSGIFLAFVLAFELKKELKA